MHMVQQPGHFSDFFYPKLMDLGFMGYTAFLWFMRNTGVFFSLC